ncbi:MAG: hypothetical protein HDR04_20570 [Lachnospiraceae bacterium]|nr:hypothetical protein [Lachnospiraceae bacterium]
MTGHEGCIYIVCPDDEDEYDKEYFTAAEKAVSYGIHHCVNSFKVIKRWLFDRNPKGLSEEADDDDLVNVNESLSWYIFTSEGNIIYGASDEYKVPFDQEDNGRFENMFLYIKSPFGLGDIVMGPDFERPEVVTTDHDCFIEHYDRLKDHEYIQLDGSDNCIRTDCIGTNGNMYYDHTVPFHLWKIDSWEDKEYWELMKMMSIATQKGVDLYSFDFMCHEYGKRNKEEKNMNDEFNAPME